MKCGDCERYKAMYDEDADYVAAWHLNKATQRSPKPKRKRNRNPKLVWCPHDTSSVTRVISADADACSAYRNRTFTRGCLHLGCKVRFTTKNSGEWFCSKHLRRDPDPNDHIRGALRY